MSNEDFTLNNKPPQAWWRRCEGLKRIGTELVGPCPNPQCGGGTDRFHVRADGVFGCRVCEDAGAILDAARGRKLFPAGRPARSNVVRMKDQAIVDSLVSSLGSTQEPAQVDRWTYQTVAGESVTVVRPRGKGTRARRDPKGVTGPYLPFAGFGDGPVVIGEGERVMAALRAAGLNATCWIGGAGSWKNTDWSSLADREVTLWPDADEPGQKAMDGLAEHLEALRCSVSMVQVPDGVPAGWDAADTDAAQIAELVDGAEPVGESLTFQRADNVKKRRVEWLVPDWVPKRGITLIAGQPGAGKTTLALNLAAAVSTGGQWGGVKVERGDVVLFAGEDTWPEVIVPNLEANGADLSRIIQPTQSHGESFSPGHHIEQLSRALTRPEYRRVKLLILDPALAIIAGVKDEYRANDIREALEPVVRMAEDRGIAIVAITHFLKRHNSSGSNVLDRVLGSQAWGAVARVVLGVEHQEAGRVCMRVKSNWGKNTGGFNFEIRAKDIPGGFEGKEILTGPMVEGRADEVMGGQSFNEPMSPARDEAEDWLRQYMEDYPFGVSWADAVKDAKKAGGITEKTLRNARVKIGMDKYKKPVKDGGQWMWRMVSEPGEK